MKKLSSVLAAVLLLAVFIPAGNQTAFAQQITKEQLEDSFDRMSAFIVSVAEAMPAEHYGFKPTEEMMSFGEQMSHLAGSFYWIGGTMLKKEGGKRPEGTTKTQIIKDMKDGIEFAKSALKDFNMDDFSEEIDWFQGPKRTRFLGYLFAIDHMTHHKGYLLVYLRLKNVTPPGYVGW